jgi:acyl-CoA thioester hydrolase
MPRVFSIRRRVQFAETDMAGIMHFSHYFRYMEEVEHAFFRSLGMSVVLHHQQVEGFASPVEIGWPRVSCECEYFGPIRFEDEIELKLIVMRVGGKSLTYEVEFLKDGQRRALGKLTSVCCAMSEQRDESGAMRTMRAVTIPPEIRRKLEGIG